MTDATKPPSEAAMQAAFELCTRVWHRLETPLHPECLACTQVARALDAFAESARRDERESVRGFIEMYCGKKVAEYFDEETARLRVKP